MSAAIPGALAPLSRSRAAIAAAILVAVVAAIPDVAAAQNAAAAPPGTLEPGDPVEVEWAGEKVKGEFVEYFPNGWLTVKILSNGLEMSPTLPPDQVRVLAKPGQAKAGAPAAKRPMRTWTDTTGKFKTKARFVELDGEKVTLETDKGKRITIALEKLSDGDQAMAKKIAATMAKEAPAADGGDDGDPFAGGPDREPAPAVAMVDGDWSECRTVVVAASAPAMVPADARELPDLPAAKPAALAAGGPQQFFEQVSGVLANRSSGAVCAVIRDTKPGAAGSTRLQFVDRASGRASAPVALDSQLKPVDLSPSGSLLLARSDQMFAMGLVEPALGVWRIGKGGLEPVALWNPKASDEIHRTPPSHAAFVDEDHVISVMFPGTITLWNVAAKKALWQLKLVGVGSPAASPGGRYVAVPAADAVIVLEALTGDAVARLPCPAGALSSVAFSPDGTRLAGVAAQQVKVWDLATGELTHDFALGESTSAGFVLWTDPEHLLIDGTNLVDLARRVVLWRYQSPPMSGFAGTTGSGGTDVWFATSSPDRSTRALVPLRLPHDQARQRAAGLDAEKLLAIRPGTAVALEVRVSADAAEQERVRQGLLRQIAAAGLVAQDGAPLRLEAVTETGETREISYRTFGSANREGEKVRVTEHICRLRIVEADRMLWQSMSVSGAPGFLQTEQGQSIQDALAPYQKPNLAFFENVTLPRYLARPGEGGAYGTSEVTPQGLRGASQPATRPGIR